MPARDRYHDIVARCLIRAGWSIIKERYALVVAEDEDNFAGCSSISPRNHRMHRLP